MEITGVLAKISAVLSEAKIPYAVTGGVAVTVWGRARYTADVDIIVDIAPQKIKQLVSALLKIDTGVYLDIDVETPIDIIKQRGGFNLIHSQSGVKADFIIKKTMNFRAWKLNKRLKKIFMVRKFVLYLPRI